MSLTLNPIAELHSVDSGVIVTPNKEYHEKRKQYKFFCPDHDCKDLQRKMFIKKSSLGKIFFSHYKGFDHDIQPETLLHKLAIKWFENKTEFEVPKVKVGSAIIAQKVHILDSSKTELEFRGIGTVRPDVFVETTNSFKLAIEIKVTHGIDEEKLTKLMDSNTPTIEIDLGDFYYDNMKQCRVDKEFIENHLDQLLTNLSLKKWIVPPEVERCEDELLLKEESDKNGRITVPPETERSESELLVKEESDNTWWIIAAIAGIFLVVGGVFDIGGFFDRGFRKLFKK